MQREWGGRGTARLSTLSIVSGEFERTGLHCRVQKKESRQDPLLVSGEDDLSTSPRPERRRHVSRPAQRVTSRQTRRTRASDPRLNCPGGGHRRLTVGRGGSRRYGSRKLVGVQVGKKKKSTRAWPGTARRSKEAERGFVSFGAGSMGRSPEHWGESSTDLVLVSLLVPLGDLFVYDHGKSAKSASERVQAREAIRAGGFKSGLERTHSSVDGARDQHMPSQTESDRGTHSGRESGRCARTMCEKRQSVSIGTTTRRRKGPEQAFSMHAAGREMTHSLAGGKVLALGVDALVVVLRRAKVEPGDPRG